MVICRYVVFLNCRVLCVFFDFTWINKQGKGICCQDFFLINLLEISVWNFFLFELIFEELFSSLKVQEFVWEYKRLEVIFILEIFRKYDMALIHMAYI